MGLVCKIAPDFDLQGYYKGEFKNYKLSCQAKAVQPLGKNAFRRVVNILCTKGRLNQGLSYYYLQRRRRDFINARNKFIQAKRLGVETTESQQARARCDDYLNY